MPHYTIIMQDGTTITDVGVYTERCEAVGAARDLAAAIGQLHTWTLETYGSDDDHFALRDPANDNLMRTFAVEERFDEGDEHTFICGLCAHRSPSSESHRHGRMLVCGTCWDTLVDLYGTRYNGNHGHVTDRFPTRPRHHPGE